MKRAWVEFTPAPAWPLVIPYRVFATRPRSRFGQPLPPGEWTPPIRPVPGRGYPRILVEHDGFVFAFVSIEEMRECARVLGLALVRAADADARWYRKLPAKVKAPRARREAATLILRAADAFERSLPKLVSAPGGLSTFWLDV